MTFNDSSGVGLVQAQTEASKLTDKIYYTYYIVNLLAFYHECRSLIGSVNTSYSLTKQRPLLCVFNVSVKRA